MGSLCTARMPVGVDTLEISVCNLAFACLRNVFQFVGLPGDWF